MKKLLLILMTALIVFSIASCGSTPDDSGNQNQATENDDFDTSKVTLTSAYSKAQSLGFEGTLDEFIELISGDDGKDGKDGANGVGITSLLIDNNGDLIVVLTDGKTINCGKVKGADGKDGVDGAPGKDGIDGKTPYIQAGYWYIDGVNTGIKAEGVDGTNGATIKDITFDENGRVIITLTDGTILDPVEIPEMHNFGALQLYGEAKANCEDNIYYVVCSDCNYIEFRQGDYDSHVWNNLYLSDGYYHWHKCANCEVTKDSARHIYDNNCDAECNECGYDRTVYAHVYDNACDANCNECGEERIAPHIWDNACDANCNGCDEQRAVPDHLYDNNCDAYCNECGEERVPADHIYDNTCDVNCNECEAAREIRHTYDNDCDAICNVCEAERTTPDHEYENYICMHCGYSLYSEGLEYTSNGDGTCYVSGIGTCTDTDIVIPAVSPNGEKVIGIAQEAFDAYRNYANNKITSVVIPNGVLEIGDSAFGYCTNLTNIVIPDSIIHVGDYAFYNCNNLSCNEYDNSFYLGNKSNPYVVLLKAKSTDIVSVDIHKNTKIIYSYAFQSCSQLTSIEISNNIIYIGRAAFKSCYMLEKIYYNANVLDVFDSCSAVFGYAGRDSSGLKLIIGQNVTSIPSYMFSGYDDTHASPLNVIEIEFEEGSVCSSLGIFAFANCYNIQSIVIPSSVVEIDQNAFGNCYSLNTIYYRGNPNEWDDITIHYSNNEIYNSLIYYYSETAPTTEGNFWHYVDGVPTVWDAYVAPETPAYSVGLEYTSNGDGTCYVSGIGTCEDTNIVIPSISPEGLTVIGIGENAFYNCKSISYVEFPNTLKEIGAHAFENCWGLQSIDIPYGVVRISEYAFNECSFAKSLSIPDSVTNIGAYAFGSCRSITILSIPKGIDKIECYTFGALSALQILKIPNNIKVIEDLAFAFIYSLDNVIISDSVTSIGKDVFCSSGISKGKPIDIFYEGTFEEWTQIIINPQNDDLTNATMYYYSVTAPTTEGNFWHYVDGVPTIWG